jgi:prepilin-type N-terminal cleavage/methylation domain-containing protein
MITYVTDTKKRIIDIQRKKQGFTLIELLVSIALVAVILSMIYSVFSASNNFFGVNDRRADAQAQLRMVMAGLKKEVSTAGYVEIADTSRIPLNNTEEVYYAGVTASNDYTLLHEVIGNTTVAFSNLPLKELQLTFSYSSSKPKILQVSMTTSEGYDLSGEILSPNVAVTGNSSGVKLVIKQAH